MTDQTLWVFGYGSLIWDPGFRYTERVIATLSGYHRSFCMRSIHHRGSQTKPGLVLALDNAPDATCAGLGFAVAPDHAQETLDHLRERELISSAYLELMVPLVLADGREVSAVAYVIDRDHVQYCGGLPLSEQAGIIAHAVGGRGPNTEYLFNTTQNLDDLGIEDRDMRWLSERVRAMAKV